MKIARWSAEKISRRCFYLLMAMAAIVYMPFLLIGADTMVLVDTVMGTPLFATLLIGFVELLLVVAVAVAVWMWIKQVRTGGHRAVVNGINLRLIGISVAAGTLLVLLVTFALGSDTPLYANGEDYTSPAWLRIADMFIFTATVLILVAAGAVVYGATRYGRKRKDN